MSDDELTKEAPAEKTAAPFKKVTFERAQAIFADYGLSLSFRDEPLPAESARKELEEDGLWLPEEDNTAPINSPSPSPYERIIALLAEFDEMEFRPTRQPTNPDPAAWAAYWKERLVESLASLWGEPKTPLSLPNVPLPACALTPPAYARFVNIGCYEYDTLFRLYRLTTDCYWTDGNGNYYQRKRYPVGDDPVWLYLPVEEDCEDDRT